MFCPKCGNQIEGMPDVCPMCHQNISEDSQLLRQGETVNVNLDNFSNSNTMQIPPVDTYIPPAPPPPKAPKPPKPLNTKITLPIISLVLSVIFLVVSVFGTVLTNVSVAKASDETCDAFVGGEKPAEGQNKETQYEGSKITKPEVSIGALSNLVPDSAGAATARNDIAVIESAISTAESEVSATYPSVTEETIYYYISAVNSVARDLYFDDFIEYYESNSDCIIFELNGGGYYIYAPHILGYDAGSSSDVQVKVSTYQPFLSKGHYGSGYEKYATYPDDAAGKLAATFEPYVFKNDGSVGDNNNDNEEVDLEKVVKLGENGVVFWHGHGTYSYNHGPLISLGVARTETLDAKYYSLFKEGTILWSKDSYVIGPEFVKKYVPDNSMKNTVLYIGTCKSGYDSTLAQAFLDKGAEAVYATTNSINTGYNASMMKSIADGLSTTKSDGTYNTVSDALEYAKSVNGSYDGIGGYSAEVKLFTKSQYSYSSNSYESTYSLDWYKDYVICDKDIVLLLDVSGSMEGEPMDQTKTAAVKFIDEVLDDSSRVALVTFDSYAQVVNDFSVRNSMVEANIKNLSAGGGTDMEEGLIKSEELLDGSSAKKKIIILMSDGYPNQGLVGESLIDYAETIKNKGVEIYTLGFFHALDAYSKADAEALLRGIASDGMDYNVNTADDLEPFFADIAANIGGQKYYYIEIACPVDVTVKKDGEELCSKEGDLSTHSSFGTLSFQQVDKDNASEDIGEQKKILRLKDGVEYDIVIEGNGNGEMDYTIRFMDENGKYTDTREFNNIKITRKTVVETVASSMRDSTVVSVDEDGDGKADKIYEAKSNSNGNIVDDTLHIVFFTMDFVFGAWLIASILFLVLRMRNRKKAKLKEFVDSMEVPVAN